MENESILESVKKPLGILSEETHFDQDILMHINSTFLTLQQLGVGPEEGFSISDENDVWSDFLSDKLLLNTVKTYMYLKVRLAFDPPQLSSVADSIKRMIDECEWRMNVRTETG